MYGATGGAVGGSGGIAARGPVLLSGGLIAPLPSAPGGRVGGFVRAPGGNGGGWVLPARGGGGGVDGAVRAGAIGWGIPPEALVFGGPGIAAEAPVVEPVLGAGIAGEAPVAERVAAADGVTAIAATGAAGLGEPSRIALSSWRRASDPGGGGGRVFDLGRVL